MTDRLMSLRKFSRVAPSLDEPVLLTFQDAILGRFEPVPRPAQDPLLDGAQPVEGVAATTLPGVAPARTGAPEVRRRAVAQEKRDTVLARINRPPR